MKKQSPTVSSPNTNPVVTDKLPFEEPVHLTSTEASGCLECFDCTECEFISSVVAFAVFTHWDFS